MKVCTKLVTLMAASLVLGMGCGSSDGPFRENVQSVTVATNGFTFNTTHTVSAVVLAENSPGPGTVPLSWDTANQSYVGEVAVYQNENILLTLELDAVDGSGTPVFVSPFVAGVTLNDVPICDEQSITIPAGPMGTSIDAVASRFTVVYVNVPGQVYLHQISTPSCNE